MKKSNIHKLEEMAQDFLQYRYKMWLRFGKRDADWCHYQGACDMIDAFGGSWKRVYAGDQSQEAEDDIRNYHHIVWFPDDEKCKRLNVDAWKD